MPDLNRNSRLRARANALFLAAIATGMGGAWSNWAQAEVHTVGVPALSSRPGAAYTVYLDFAGFTFTGNWGNGSGVPGATPAYNNITTSFGTGDQNNIKAIWSRVAEKYSAFNVNVTTVDPAVLAGKAGTDAARQLYYDVTPRMMHTVIGNGTWTGGGGVSYVGVTQGSYAGNPGINGGNGIGYHTNWLFTNSLGGAGGISYIAEAGAHENGHGFGLSHQSDFTGTTVTNEYSGNNNSTGNGSYAPIMGVSYYSQRGVWRSGTADAGSLTQQNDVQKLLSNSGMTTLLDDGVGHSTAAATPMPINGTNVDYMRARGIIEPASSSAPNPTGVSNYTSDLYSFSSTGGSVTLTLKDGTERLTPGSADGGATLVSTLSILDSTGAVLYTASNNPATLSETITQTLPAGNYYAQVSSLGGGSGTFAGTTNYYYDMGSYFLSGSGIVSANTGAFYFAGGATTTKWNQIDPGSVTNWRTDHNNALDPGAAPSATSNVFFTPDTTAASLTTTLGGNRTINSLNFTGTGTTAAGTSVTIAADGSTLSLSAAVGYLDASGNAYPIGTGLAVQAGSAAHTLAANVALLTSQTWQVNNSAANPLTVSGTISGTGSALTMTGSGKLVLSHANTYTGGTNLLGGTLNFVNGGLGTGFFLIGNGAVLQYATGNTQDLTSGLFILSNGGGQIDTNGNNPAYAGAITGAAGGSLSKLGTGTLTLNGSANPSNLFVKAGAVTLGSSGTLSTATTPQTTVNNYSSIGQTIGDNGAITLTGSSIFTAAGDLNIADVSAIGTLNVQGTSTVNARTFSVGKYLNSLGTVNQTGGTVQQVDNGTAGTDWRIGGYGGTADAAAVGIYNLSAGSLNSGAANLQVGGYGTGTVNQTGGIATIGGFLSIGRFAGGIGTWDMSSNLSVGSVIATAQVRSIVGEAGIGILKIGSLSSFTTQALNLAWTNGATGTVQQTGGTVTATAGVQFSGSTSGIGAGSTGIYNLSGGVLATPSVTKQAITAVSGTLNFNGGTLRAISNNVSLITGLTNANVQAGGAIIDSNANSVSVDQILRHDPSLGATTDGGLQKIGTGNLTLTAVNTFTGTTNVTAGTLTITPTGALPTGGAINDSGTINFNAQTSGGILTRTQGAITLNAASSLNLLNPAARANRTLLVASALNLNSTAKLDLAGNDLIVQNGNLAALTASVQSSYANGSWTGNGITSTAAAGDTAHLTALGTIANGTLYGTSGSLGLFDNYSPASADVLIKYTYFGDANLDGKVNGADYSRLDFAYLADLSNPLASTGWYNGDFNYDGLINGSDYTLIDNTYNTQGASLAAALASNDALPTAQIAQQTAVPEPGMLGAVCIGAMGLLSRRKNGTAKMR